MLERGTRLFNSEANYKLLLARTESLRIPGEAARRSGMMPPTNSEMISPTVPR
jgi:hypothetical protein